MKTFTEKTDILFREILCHNLTTNIGISEMKKEIMLALKIQDMETRIACVNAINNLERNIDYYQHTNIHLSEAQSAITGKAINEEIMAKQKTVNNSCPLAWMISLISTAPTDDRDILCWNGNCWFTAVAKGKHTSCAGYIDPTHWCELPERQ